ncbi:MAG TPA: cytochrome c [Vicinamibacterales bacterium]|nr:cytochrome c [Vicinamibacterales bacterium]
MSTKRVACLFAAACVMVAAPGIVRAAQGTAKTTWDGVYADAQARTGETLYADKCAECHAANGSGGFGPPLAGPVFATGWDGMPLSDLFDRIKATAPASNPRTLSKDEVTALIAYLLEMNGFPSGPSDLPNTAELLKPIRFVSANPNAGH